MSRSDYNIKALQERGHGIGTETGGAGTAGLYRHPQSGEEMVTLSDPLFGDVQSNAAERLGFVRVGDTPEGYVKSIELQSVISAAAGDDSAKGLSARIAALEGTQARNTELEKTLEEYRQKYESGAATDSPAVQTAVQTTKEDAAEQVALRGQGDATDEVEDEAPEVTDFQANEVNDDVDSETVRETKKNKKNKK